MKLDLPGLELLLSTIQGHSIGVGLAQGLDGVPNPREVVEGRVDDAIRARPQDRLEL